MKWETSSTSGVYIMRKENGSKITYKGNKGKHRIYRRGEHGITMMRKDQRINNGETSYW